MSNDVIANADLVELRDVLFGNTTPEGHSLRCYGVAIWVADVAACIASPPQR